LIANAYTLNMLTDRGEQILQAVIQGFIDTREPVSSGWLYNQYDFGIKPAMIRLELDALTNEGYLEQPYHSAGRVPTDAGYELFARRLLAAQEAALRETAMRHLFLRSAWTDLIGELSSELGILGVVAAHDMVYKTGLGQLMNNLDWSDRAGIQSVIRDFEAVDERAPRAGEHIGLGPQVFIGKKSPVTKSENLAVVGGNYKVGNATVSVFAIGPKCMDYKKAIRIFRNL
jgi:transcriptional regulator of heat shock response